MENEIKEVFEQIHADRALKEETKRYVYHNTCGYRARNLHIYRKFAILAACIVVFFCGTGGFMYITPVSVISIDVNPSIELEINRFDRIIHVKGYNQDGIELAESIQVQNMVYSDGINIILKMRRSYPA